MPNLITPNTPQHNALLEANLCPAPIATLLGLSFADRDLDLIEHLRQSTDLPNEKDFPTAPAIAAALNIEPRWAIFTLEKVKRFLHKRRINGNYSADLATFNQVPQLPALAEQIRHLPRSPTVFIGDSVMDTRHFSANATFPILAGNFLQQHGAGPFINAGIGGNTTAQGLARFDKDALAHHPVRIVLAFGSNDLSNRVPMEKIMANFQAMIDKAHQANAHILLGLALHVLPDRLWWNKDPMHNIDPATRQNLQREMETLATRKKIPCMNVLTTLRPDHYCIDGIHLNQQGHELCALETLTRLCSEYSP